MSGIAVFGSMNVVQSFGISGILNSLHIQAPHIAQTLQKMNIDSNWNSVSTPLAVLAGLILAALAVMALRHAGVWLRRKRPAHRPATGGQNGLLHKPSFWFVVVAVAALAFNVVYPFRVAVPHISLAPEEITRVGGLHITNTLISTWMGMLVLIGGAYLATRHMQVVPGRLQNLVEFIIETLSNLVEGIAGPRTPAVMPIVVTFFLLIVVCNWMGLMPGYMSIYILRGEEHIPLLRSAATDMNLTLALALSSVATSQVLGIRAAGWGGYLRRFVKIDRFIAFGQGLLGNGPRRGAGDLLYGVVDLFVGALELVDEFVKVLSFSFRLFGNVFAGEVLLGVVPFLIPLVASLPFLGLELLVGFIQAFVFAVLSTAFMAQATAVHGALVGAHGEKSTAPPDGVCTAR